MPKEDYIPPKLFDNGHIQTVFPVLFRKVESVIYTRERIDTPDNDFLDLDWSVRGKDRLAVISHGLEGNTGRAYVKGMVRALNENGWDVLAWNYRSCSGEANRLLRSYHNGVTDDLASVIRHAQSKQKWHELSLVGFSLGGNLTLLYLGREKVSPLVKKAVVFSVPCDLKSSALRLRRWSNAIYMKRFLVLLHQKIKAKMALFPELINDHGYNGIKDFKGFDDRYTAPIHGFKNAEDYWKKCSSRPYLKNIRVPALMINAEDDPFLSSLCYPVKAAAANPYLTLKVPRSGGHVGFVQFNPENLYWSEEQAVAFLNRPYVRAV